MTETPLHYLFSIKPGHSLSSARKELKKLGLTDIYVIEDKAENACLIGGYLLNALLPNALSHVEVVESSSMVDWESQASLFSPYYENGILQIPLENFGESKEILHLIPGEGFGDLSHPTTEMMLLTLSKKVKNKRVVDIGCGNGILSLASLYFGAKKVWGLDIEEKAIALSKENQKQNGLQENIEFLFPSDFSPEENPEIVLLNMISSEQETAWNSLPFLHDLPLEIIVSGVGKFQRKDYLQICKKRNWEICEEFEKENWLTFVILQNKPLA